jgi:hypothetical protein
MDIELSKPPDDDHPEGAIDVFWMDDQRVVVRYRHIPEKDLDVVKGIPCTTALRTVIDLAPELPADDLRLAVTGAMQRGLFSLEEALARTEEPDMVGNLGALLLRAELLRSG